MAESIPCPTCGKVMGSASALTAHTKKEHAGDAVAAVAAKWKGQAPRPGGAWRPDRPLRAAPSGVPSIDYAIGIGGVPRGTCVEVFGPSKGGKTFIALTFAAYAQKHGGIAGYVDAEEALQATFAKLIPDLNLDTLYYAPASCGEDALNMSKDYVSTGIYDAWIIDSVHGCTPRALLDKPIGDATMAELAKLMSVGCQVLEHVVAKTDTVLIFVNHIKQKPGVLYGSPEFRPGGTALDYYTSIQLRCSPVSNQASGSPFSNKEGRRIGHRIKIKVEKSKVSAPYGTAEADLYYADDIPTSGPRAGQKVKPGVDLASSWYSVLKEHGNLRFAGNAYHTADPFTGEAGNKVGNEREVLEILDDPSSDLLSLAHSVVYDTGYTSKTKKDPVTA